MSIDNAARKITRVPRSQPFDPIMTPQDVCEMLKINMNQLYKFNSNGLPMHKQGKLCRYLRSEVMNWFMNNDTRIKDDPSLHRNLPPDDLPVSWVPPDEDDRE